MAFGAVWPCVLGFDGVGCGWGSGSGRVCFGVGVLVRLVECPAEGSSRLVGLFGGVCRKFENSTACLGQCQWPNVHHLLVVGVWFIFLMHTTFQVCVSSLTNFVGFLLRCNNLF